MNVANRGDALAVRHARPPGSLPGQALNHFGRSAISFAIIEGQPLIAQLRFCSNRGLEQNANGDTILGSEDPEYFMQTC